MARITWHGDRVLRHAAEAAAMGIDRVMADCVDDARSGHAAYPPASAPGEPYANRTDFATQAIRAEKPATPDPADLRVAGHWGGYANYMLFLEIGTSVAGPTATGREQAADGNMGEIAEPIGPLMAARPTLRPAADRHYPSLARYIGEAFRGEELL